MSRRPAVLIVGAGPVGLTAAVELTRRGFTPRIVDAGTGPVPVDQSRALAILPATLDLLEASGLSAELLSRGNRIAGARLRSGGRALIEIKFATAARRTAHPFILALAQGRTERAMIDWLGNAGVPVEWNTSIAALRDTHRPVVTLSSGETLAVGAVVGCDGAQSWLRRELGLPWVGSEDPGRFALVDVALDAPADASMVEIDLEPGQGAAAMIPLDARTRRLIGVEAGTNGLTERAETLGRIVWTSDFSVAYRHSERMARGRVFLAGDAAHVHSPVGGRGMNLGIADAATLAFLLETGRESEYESLRLPVVRRVMAQTHAATRRVTAPNAAFLTALRWLGPAALAMPGVERRIASAMLALDLPRAPWL